MYIDSQAKILQQFQEIAKPAKLAHTPQALGNIPTRPVAANDRYQKE